MNTKICCLLSLAMSVPLLSNAEEAHPKNVVFIVIDDLNDWVGCMGAHPQVQTPHIDALAKRGMLFTNAHVQATYCGPSRISLLSGRMPQTTDCRSFDRYEKLKSLTGHAPLPLHFRDHGFETFGGGKIFHHGTGDGWVARSWSTVLPSGKNPTPAKRMNWQKKVWDWGAFPAGNIDMGDFRLAKAAAAVVRGEHKKPFFVVAGFRRPHVPLHVPQEWFDLYPVDEIVLPKSPADDLNDVPHPELGLEFHAAPEHAKVVDRQLWRSLVQAYLASISFVDHCVGEVMRGLDDGPNRENTLVVLMSDHGFHLGEKQHWAKRTLWEETTRVPLIVAGPGVKEDSRSGKPVGLIDIYPTLCDVLGKRHLVAWRATHFGRYLPIRMRTGISRPTRHSTQAICRFAPNTGVTSATPMEPKSCTTIALTHTSGGTSRARQSMRGRKKNSRSSQTSGSRTRNPDRRTGNTNRRQLRLEPVSKRRCQ